MKLLLIVVALFLASCSTIDRRSYFTPQSDVGEVSGPKDLYCGMYQTGNLPDSVTFMDVSYRANESFEPYMWGPWLITIYPVFPLTWVADLFINPNLKIYRIYSSNQGIKNEPQDIAVLVKLKNGDEVKLQPIKEKLPQLEFSVKTNEVRSFSLILDGDKEIAKYTRASRWSWTQICIN